MLSGCQERQEKVWKRGDLEWFEKSMDILLPRQAVVLASRQWGDEYVRNNEMKGEVGRCGLAESEVKSDFRPRSPPHRLFFCEGFKKCRARATSRK